ncbi:MAG: polyribonucleotide nucleotidyltransferase [Candidatus Aminicenantes bacterium]|nr:polyribonucleotide nucleotidyltransferase [Candidatus Aminicenantes bacterium]
MSHHKINLQIGNRELNIEINKLARQADGSAVLRYGDTVLFVSACAKREKGDTKSFLPLIVDYRENTYAAGKIPGGFFKREGRPTDREILMSRLIDRPIRPLFPDNYFNETQVIARLLSADIENEADTLGIIGASVALYFSPIPYSSPLGAVKVGLVNGQLAINPPKSEIDECPLDMVVVGNEDGIVVIEAGADQASEEVIIQACQLAQEPIKKIINAQKELFQQLNIKKQEVTPKSIDQAKYDSIKQKISSPLREAIKAKNQPEMKTGLNQVKDSLLDEIPEDNENEINETKEIYDRILKELVRSMIIKEKIRPDGRQFDEIRPISIETGMLPRTHGSALFTRGETQSLCTVTLGTFEDTQTIDGLGEESEKKFMVHYNFPPFSVGEVAFLRGPGRREIGHGALAEKAMLRSVPKDDGEFPYTIRLVSDILESNGSSSMATVCGGVLALMDAGVPLSMTVAGIAIGLISQDEEHILLSDIAGFEDHFGDMDLKVAGTDKGITAVQMDLKIPSLSLEVLKQAFEKARQARLKVLSKMNEALSTSRPDISPYAPRIINLFVNPSKVGEVIGPSGKTIKKIISETKAKIDIEEDGKITIASPDMEAVHKAERMINDITEEPEVGKIYEGKVVRIEDYGAFVQILPNADGLLHISEISHRHIKNIRDVLKMGQKIKVKVTAIDDKNRVRLSKKAIEDKKDSYKNKKNTNNKNSRYQKDKRKKDWF